MKNIDVKKLIVLLVIVAAIVVAIVLIAGKGKDKEKGANEEKTQVAQSMAIQYILDATENYQTKYNGIDRIFAKDKTVLSDLSDASIINTGIKYIDNNGGSGVDNIIINKLTNDMKVDMSKYTAYRGEDVKNAIKEIFGIDFEHKSVLEEENYLKSFWYVDTYDVYLVGSNPNCVNTYKNDYLVSYRPIITTEEKDGSLKTEIAVAYIYVDSNGNASYSNNPNISNIIFEGNSSPYEIPEDKVNSFDHYIVTLKKDNNKYIFDSISKK